MTHFSVRGKFPEGYEVGSIRLRRPVIRAEAAVRVDGTQVNAPELLPG